jgi:hypothetical protein
VCKAPVAAPEHRHYAVELFPDFHVPAVLRLVLGGHSRAPQPYGPRLCAKHQSLRPNIVITPWDYPPAFPFLTMLRRVFDTRRQELRAVEPSRDFHPVHEPLFACDDHSLFEHVGLYAWHSLAACGDNPPP